MAFKVKAFREILSASKEALDEALAPMRAKSARAKATLFTATLEEKLVTIEREIHELCAKKDLDFDAILDKIDQFELTERRIKQANGVIGELFPEKE